MKIIIVGATVTIGRAVVNLFESKHEVIKASRNGDVRVDLSNPDSIKEMYGEVSDIDAVVCAAGDAKFGPLDSFNDEDFQFSLSNKLMGQVNLVRFGRGHLNEVGYLHLQQVYWRIDQMLQLLYLP